MKEKLMELRNKIDQAMYGECDPAALLAEVKFEIDVLISQQ